MSDEPRIEGRTAYVQTVAGAIAASEIPGVDDVVIEDRAESIKMQRIVRSFQRLRL